jgi:malonyl-CoA O-methyltransferase
MKHKEISVMLDSFNLAKDWIYNFTLINERSDEGGISVSSKSDKLYPEVTGYFIPTLLNWGEKGLAKKYAKWLCSIQKPDGSWYDSNNEAPYVFDTCQILKGLIAIMNILPEVSDNIIKGCNWVISNIKQNGQLITPSTQSWGSICNELVHLYCLSPLIEAAKLFDIPEYEDNAKKVLKYYLQNYKNDILNFYILSHFYAYIIEGLIDIGEIKLAEEAMVNINQLQKPDGLIPAYRNVKWVCSTGLFQFALIYYKMGKKAQGDLSFKYAVSLQNDSGGWFGGYPINIFFSKFLKKHRPDYFPDAEIAWAVKYFLDALHLKLQIEFEEKAPIFLEKINIDDGRYQLVKNTIIETRPNKILDVGCGKGRYLLNLLSEKIGKELYGIDISLRVMANIASFPAIKVKQGSLLNIPYSNSSFDFVYTCEALEHCINLDAALEELKRVITPGGHLLIIDKNKEKLGFLQIEDFEQWFDPTVLAEKLKKIGFTVKTYENIPYENKQDGLFCAWIAKKE